MQWSRDADFMFNNPRKKFSPQKRSHSAPGYGKVMRYLLMSRHKSSSGYASPWRRSDGASLGYIRGHGRLPRVDRTRGATVVTETSPCTSNNGQRSLSGVTFDTLTVPDKKSIICCILKVIATNQRRCCQELRPSLRCRPAAGPRRC
jgi:hypothetical protein